MDFKEIDELTEEQINELFDEFEYISTSSHCFSRNLCLCNGAVTYYVSCSFNGGVNTFYYINGNATSEPRPTGDRCVTVCNAIGKNFTGENPDVNIEGECREQNLCLCNGQVTTYVGCSFNNRDNSFYIIDGQNVLVRGERCTDVCYSIGKSWTGTNPNWYSRVV